ncbi:MAG: hypothetical protein IKE63_05835 [Bacilli bacterium]|nr:hypothetical protein [Bacilli bacterium]
MKLSDDQKLFEESLLELNVKRKTIIKVLMYLKRHKIDYKEYLQEVRKNNPKELTSGRLFDIAISIYEGNLYEREGNELSLKMYENELKIREKYHDIEDKREESKELDKNKEWYLSQIKKLKEKYHRE